MPHETFQDRSFRFALAILRLYRKVLASDRIPRHVATQACRAGTSIGANIAEAKSAYLRRDMAAKYAIALREARECHYWLSLTRTDQPLLAHDIEPLTDEVNQLVAMLTAAVRKLRSPILTPPPADV